MNFSFFSLIADSHYSNSFEPMSLEANQTYILYANDGTRRVDVARPGEYVFYNLLFSCASFFDLLSPSRILLIETNWTYFYHSSYVKIKRQSFPVNDLIGHEYGTVFEAKGKHLYPTDEPLDVVDEAESI